jgi:intein/homing endonuclease
MNVEEVMKTHGFNLSASCAGKASYTKWIKYKGRRAYIIVTDTNGDNFPNTLDEPVKVTIQDLKSGDELETPQVISSLGSYLASLDGD